MNNTDIENIKTLDVLLENYVDKKTIDKLPCKALQTYNELHNHYIRVKKDIFDNLVSLNVNNPGHVLNLIENDNISCENYSKDDEELVNNINKNVIKTTIDYTKITVYVIILVMFCFFIYFFERRRCICPVPTRI